MAPFGGCARKVMGCVAAQTRRASAQCEINVYKKPLADRWTGRNPAGLDRFCCNIPGDLPRGAQARAGSPIGATLGAGGASLRRLRCYRDCRCRVAYLGIHLQFSQYRLDHATPRICACWRQAVLSVHRGVVIHVIVGFVLSVLIFGDYWAALGKDAARSARRSASGPAAGDELRDPGLGGAGNGRKFSLGNEFHLGSPNVDVGVMENVMGKSLLG
jgi:hypothetical protein